MRIEGIIAAYSPASLKRASGASSGRDGASGSSARKFDSVQISEEARQRLDKVRQRIERGYYNSDSVRDDISDKLSGVLNEIT